MVTDDVHDLGHGVLRHPTAHAHLEVSLPCDLAGAGGEGAESVGVHNAAVVKLFKARYVGKGSRSSYVTHFYRDC